MLKTTKWDMAEHIKTPEDVVLYLQAALEDNDTELLLAVVGDCARSQGMAEIAKKLNLSRESLYRSLSENGNLSFATVMKVLKALGFSLRIVPAA